MGSIVGPGRFHIPRKSGTHELKQLSLCAAEREATTKRRLCTTTKGRTPLTTTRETLGEATKTQCHQKLKINK